MVFLGVKDCERKTVTPLDAFLYKVKCLIIVPLTAVGTGMGGFGKEMFSKLFIIYLIYYLQCSIKV